MKFFVFRLKHVIIAALALAAAFVIGFSVPRAVSVFNVNGREIPIYSVERDDNKIALTFDCAWGDEDVDAVLKTLDEYGCKATFFVTGEWASRHSKKSPTPVTRLATIPTTTPTTPL